MKPLRTRRFVVPAGWLALFLCCTLTLGIPSASATLGKTAKNPLIKPGDPFPKTEFITPREAVYRNYLGLPDKPVFHLNDVKVDVLIVEFLNKYCYHCQKQAYLMNRIYKAIKKDPTLNGKVKMIGIGVGNNQIQLDHFRQEKRIPFPLIPDKDFMAFENIGYPAGTPFTIIVKKENGEFIVKDTHLGIIENRPAYMDKIRQILSGGAVEASKQSYESAYQQLNPGITVEGIKGKITQRLQKTGIKVTDITPIKLTNAPQCFMVKIEKDGKMDAWFAAIGAQGKVCDICHNIYFIYLFDRQGVIRDFIPIDVTKFGNKPFEEKEVEKMRQSLVGKSLTQPIQYNPDTDAVSSASMTSALIFKSVNEGRKLYETLKKEGYTQ